MEFNDGLDSDMERPPSWPQMYNVFRMIHRDRGTEKEVCEKDRASTLMITAGRQDIVEFARERVVKEGGIKRAKDRGTWYQACVDTAAWKSETWQ